MYFVLKVAETVEYYYSGYNKGPKKMFLQTYNSDWEFDFLII